ncbi:MAG: hypothetical protein R2819_05460 [Allomuricauda sp.]
MKTSVKFLSLLVMMAMAFSCSKDDDSSSPTPTPTNLGSGTAVLDGVSNQTPNVYAFNLGENPGNATTTNFVLDITNGTSDGTYSSPNTTTIITFDINSESASKVAAGTYVLDFSNLYSPSTFSDAYAHFHLIYHQSDKSLTGGDRYDDTVNGSLTISYEGEIAHIEYELAFADGETLTGEYNGKIKYYSLD